MIGHGYSQQDSSTPSHSGGCRERKIACYSSNDDRVSDRASQRTATTQVLVAIYRCAAAGRGLFRAVLAHDDAVGCGFSYRGAGVDGRVIDFGIEAGSDRVT